MLWLPGNSAQASSSSNSSKLVHTHAALVLPTLPCTSSSLTFLHSLQSVQPCNLCLPPQRLKAELPWATNRRQPREAVAVGNCPREGGAERAWRHASGKPVRGVPRRMAKEPCLSLLETERFFGAPFQNAALKLCVGSCNSRQRFILRQHAWKRSFSLACG